MKRKFIIDTDTASDDAVALIMAAKHPDIDIKAISLVAGNVALAQGVQNALYTLSLCKATSVKVYPGIEKPMLRPLQTADHVHGKDGMGDIGLNLSGFEPAKKHAVIKILELINKYPGEITLVCLGPLTNIAAAILLDSQLGSKLKACIIMGGIGKGRGNITPIAEYNFWADPEAAKIVFNANMPIKMVGWDISRKYAVFDEREVNRIRELDTELAHFSLDIQKHVTQYAKKSSHLKGFDLPDPIAMSIALDGSIATESKKAFVSILTNDDESRGQTCIDYTGATSREPNAEIVQKADKEKFIQLLHSALAKSK